MNSDKTAFLVMDIETVVDGRLVQRVRYPGENELNPAAAVARHRSELLERSQGKSDFVPYTFHVPVSVAIAKVASDFSLQEVITLDRPKFRPQVIARKFWKGWSAYGQPTLVTFNGRGFDLPVLEMAAFRYGIAVQPWFASTSNQYQQPRNRFNTNAHLDLQDFIGNQGAAHVQGGLNLCALLLGKPGKMETKGSMVQELWERGERERIDDYCQCDVLDTYFVFLRTRMLAGLITLERERQLVEQARAWIEQASAHNLTLAEYLRNFHFWTAVGDDADPFLRDE